MHVAVRKLLAAYGDEVGSITTTGHSLGTLGLGLGWVSPDPKPNPHPTWHCRTLTLCSCFSSRPHAQHVVGSLARSSSADVRPGSVFCRVHQQEVGLLRWFGLQQLADSVVCVPAGWQVARWPVCAPLTWRAHQ